MDRSGARPVDRALADLAGGQHGRVALGQLEELGLRHSAVARRVAGGRLHRVHPGVYAVGHRAETPQSRCMSAVLACGPGAALSHRSAAAHWGLRPNARAAVDVTVPGRRGRGLAGIDDHCSRTLQRADVTTVPDVPCTTVSRTLLDLADVVGSPAPERAIEATERLRAFDGGELQAVLARGNGRRGVGVLRAILARYEEPPLTQRELERRFVELCERAGIATPRTQAAVDLGYGDTVFADWSGRTPGSSSRPTAMRPTARVGPSSAIAGVTVA